MAAKVCYKGETWYKREVTGAGDWLGLECPHTGRLMDIDDTVYYCPATGDWMSGHAMELSLAYDPSRA